MNQQIYTTLNNGVKMPLLGLGVYDMYRKEAEEAVTNALQIGYRLIDTAAMYRNETEIGNAIKNSSISRKDIFITTKVDNSEQGYDHTLRGFEKSLKKINVNYIDLYLIHWPIKSTRKDTWKALEKIYADKMVRAIGVANYLIPFLKEQESYATTMPTVNQVEFSPYLFLSDLLDYCKNKKIQLQAYTPLVRGLHLKDNKLVAMAEKYGKTPAQIILRWALQHGVSTIPKSSNLIRLKENFDVFDFNILPADMNKIDAFNENFRVVEDPMDLF